MLTLGIGQRHTMNKTKSLTHLFGTVALLTAMSVPATAAALTRDLIPVASEATSGIAFKLTESGGVYTVYMKPDVTPAAPNATVSAQVTIKVPHGIGAAKFTVSELTALVPGTVWEQTSRTDAPPEAPGSDYLSFTVDFPAGDVRAFNWAAGVEQAVFSFKNTGAGAGSAAAAHLIDDCDAFAPPNSINANVGNEITVLGLAIGTDNLPGNAYTGNSGQTPDCPSAADAKSAVSVAASSSATETVHAGDLVTYTYTISNSGLRSANSLTLKVSLIGLANSQNAANSFGSADPILVANSSATWNLGELAPGGHGSVTLTLAAPASNDTLTTTVEISASNDNSTADNTLSQMVQVLASAPVNAGSKVYLPVVTK